MKDGPPTAPARAHLRFFGGCSQGEPERRNLFRSNRALSAIWRNEFRAPEKSAAPPAETLEKSFDTSK